MGNRALGVRRALPCEETLVPCFVAKVQEIPGGV